MDKRALNELLVQLRDELGDSAEIGLESRLLLSDLHNDIEELLELSSEAPMQTKVDVQRGMRRSIHEFEESHPKLTEAMGHLLELLAGTGI